MKEEDKAYTQFKEVLSQGDFKKGYNQALEDVKEHIIRKFGKYRILTTERFFKAIGDIKKK